MPASPLTQPHHDGATLHVANDAPASHDGSFCSQPATPRPAMHASNSSARAMIY